MTTPFERGGQWNRGTRHRVAGGWRNAVVFLSILPGLCLHAPEGKAGGNTSLENPEGIIAHAVRVDDLIRHAFARNPSIQAAREFWRATVESHRVVTALPDPQLSVTYFPSPIETRLGPQDWNLSISQQIPFPGRLARAGEVVSVDAEIARLELDKAYRDVAVSLRESFHELQYIREAKKIAARNMALLDHLRTIAETAYAGGRTLLLDVVKAQSQTGQLRYDLLLLEDLEATETARMNGLLNREPGAVVGRIRPSPPFPLLYSLDEIYALAERHQEEIRIASQQVKKAEKELELARTRNYPDFKVGLFYAGIGSPDVPSPPSNAGDNAFGISAGVTLPIWFGRNDGRTARKAAEISAARANRAVRVNETRTRIRAGFFQLQNARRLMELYERELLPQATASMEQAETWFKQGESPFSDVIETQSVWYNFQLALARARADYGKQAARLERLAGRSLTTREEAFDTPPDGREK